LSCVWSSYRFSRNYLDALDTFLDPTYYDYTYEPRNHEELERTLLLVQTAFPGHETLIEEIVGEGDTVAVCLTLRGTRSGPFRGLPASGKPFAIGGHRFYKVSDQNSSRLHRGYG